MGFGGAGDAKKAAQAQMAGLNKAIDESRQAYSDVQGMYDPYASAGLQGFEAYLNAIGQGDAGAQQQFMDSVATNPAYQAQFSQGNRAILQNAAATGGLRGGNVQHSLADFGSNLWNQQYQQQLGQLSGLAGIGLDASGALANARMGTSQNISGLHNAVGEAQANGILAQRAAKQQTLGALGSIAGMGLGGYLGGGLKTAEGLKAAALGSGAGATLGGSK